MVTLPAQGTCSQLYERITRPRRTRHQTPRPQATVTMEMANSKERGQVLPCVFHPRFRMQHRLILRLRIILYVITGCVSALFTVVIISGVCSMQGVAASRLMTSFRPSEHSGTLKDMDLGASIRPIPMIPCIPKAAPRVWLEPSWIRSLLSSSTDRRMRPDMRKMLKHRVWN